MLTSEECLVYDTFASKYQSFLYPLLAAFVTRKVGQPIERIVDMGTGPGHLSIELAERSGAEVIAVDINPAMHSILKQHLGRRDRSLKIQCDVADVHSLPYPDAYADVVVSYSCYHHWSNPVEALMECLRILKPNGCMFIFDTRAEATEGALQAINAMIREPELFRFVSEALMESSTLSQVVATAAAAGLHGATIEPFQFSEEDLMECLDALDSVRFDLELPKGECMLWLLSAQKEA